MIALSVITVCKNDRKKLYKTIRSVLGQTYHAIEYIVIDGGSTDGTISLLKDYELRISNLKNKNKKSFFWISEKDGGIYDAMNKGIRKATGDIVYFLNAGDVFSNRRVIEKIMAFFHDVSIDIIVGNTSVHDPVRGMSYEKRHNKINNQFLFLDAVNHQAIFAKRQLFLKCGLFDTRFKIMADYDWFLRLFKRGVHIQSLDIPIARYIDEGISSGHNPSLIRLHKRERKEIIHSHFPILQRLWYSAFLPWDYIKRKKFFSTI